MPFYEAVIIMEVFKMNPHNYEKLHLLRFLGMAKAYQAQAEIEDINDWTFEERLGYLLDAEYDSHRNNKIERLIHQANFSDSGARLEAIQYLPDRELNRDLFKQLSTNQYVKDARNIVLVGATGSGKSFIACALGKNACLASLKVKYIRLPDLLTELELARAEVRYVRSLKQYQTCDVLIIDEWLLVPTLQQGQQDIFEVLEQRYKLHSTVFCSQFKPDGWYERLGSGALADAILDRALSKATQIQIGGEKPMRLRTYKSEGLAYSPLYFSFLHQIHGSLLQIPSTKLKWLKSSIMMAPTTSDSWLKMDQYNHIILHNSYVFLFLTILNIDRRY